MLPVKYSISLIVITSYSIHYTKLYETAVEEIGLFYPPDPSSIRHSTIGGNIACNAGGPRCLKYGVTGDYVLGLTVVLADGRILKTGA